MDNSLDDDLPRKQFKHNSNLNPIDLRVSHSFQESSNTPRKKFKNNEILSSYSSTKRVPVTSTTNPNLDYSIPVPIKRKRSHDDDDDLAGNESVPRKRSKSNKSSKSIAIQTSCSDLSLFDDGPKLTAESAAGPSNREFSNRLNLKGPPFVSQIQSPVRCFTLDEHKRDQEKRAARLQRYLKAIKNGMEKLKPPEPVVSVAPSIITPVVPQPPPALKLPTSAATELVSSTTTEKPKEVPKPFEFGISTTVATPAVTSASPQPLSSAPAITTVTTTVTGSIPNPVTLPSTPSFGTSNTLKVPESGFNFTFGATAAQPTDNKVVEFGSGSNFGAPNRKILKPLHRTKPETSLAPVAVSAPAPVVPFQFGAPNPAPAAQPQALPQPAVNSFNPQLPASGFNFGAPAAANPSQPFQFGQSSNTVNATIGGLNVIANNFAMPGQPGGNIFNPGTGGTPGRKTLVGRRKYPGGGRR